MRTWSKRAAEWSRSYRAGARRANPNREERWRIERRETGSWKWTFFMIGYTLVLGWLLATLIVQIGGLFGA
jgi:hypothetical protein